MNGCIYRTKYGECNIPYRSTEYGPMCRSDCTDKHPSNADRIRAMSDEELAKELSFIGDCRCPDGGECGHENGCLWCWQNWLKQEAKE